MFDQTITEKIKALVEEFFSKMTIADAQISASIEPIEKITTIVENEEKAVKGIINIKTQLLEPQVLIGQQGQTLFETQRLLRILLNKKLGENYYLNLDINDYKKNKIDYLENLAENGANEVLVTKKEKELPPMNSYERRVIHAKLSSRTDITTESAGEGSDRHLVIKPK